MAPLRRGNTQTQAHQGRQLTEMKVGARSDIYMPWRAKSGPQLAGAGEIPGVDAVSLSHTLIRGFQRAQLGHKGSLLRSEWPPLSFCVVAAPGHSVKEIKYVVTELTKTGASFLLYILSTLPCSLFPTGQTVTDGDR